MRTTGPEKALKLILTDCKPYLNSLRAETVAMQDEYIETQENYIAAVTSLAEERKVLHAHILLF